MNKEEKQSRILKATMMLSGTQGITIVVGLIRSKMAAMLIGASGMGLVAVLSSTLDLIYSITNLGISNSSIREVAIAREKGEGDLRSFLDTLWQWSWVVGLLASLFTLLLSPMLSQWCFNTDTYQHTFRILSISLLFMSLQGRNMAVLRGLYLIRIFARTNIFVQLFSLLFTLPLYYYYGMESIPYVLLFVAISGYAVSYFFSRQYLSIPVFTKALIVERFRKGGAMLRLGFFMTLSSLLTSLVSFLLTLYINQAGGIEEAGFYKSGWSITTAYVGAIFTALGTEYFPRLSQEIASKGDVSKSVNEQVRLSLLLLTPIVMLLGSFLPMVIRIVYTDEFLVLVPYIAASLPGLILKAASWALGFLFLAKADGKLFFVTEIVSLVISLSSSLIGYHFYGLTGLGVAFTITYALYMLSTILFVKYRYGILFSVSIFRTIALSFLIVFGLSVLIFTLSSVWVYWIGGGVSLCISFYSLRTLKRKIKI